MEEVKLMDIRLFFDSSDPSPITYDTGGDIKLNDNDAELDYGLTTAVLVSLYTDRRATVDDNIPDGTDNRRGWWGDSIAEIEGDRIGSRLWLLDRSKTVQDNLNRAKDYIEESLEWMVEDGIAAAIEVTTERVEIGLTREYTIGARIDILRNEGDAFSMLFEDLWNGQFGITGG